MLEMLYTLVRRQTPVAIGSLQPQRFSYVLVRMSRVKYYCHAVKRDEMPKEVVDAQYHTPDLVCTNAVSVHVTCLAPRVKTAFD
jgi:hypothetical protein